MPVTILDQYGQWYIDLGLPDEKFVNITLEQKKKCFFCEEKKNVKYSCSSPEKAILMH